MYKVLFIDFLFHFLFRHLMTLGFVARVVFVWHGQILPSSASFWIEIRFSKFQWTFLLTFDFWRFIVFPVWQDYWSQSVAVNWPWINSWTPLRSTPILSYIKYQLLCHLFILGQENFDPTSRKFSEEELKPQPIIKKSKKVKYIAYLSLVISYLLCYVLNRF